ncbi:hypothetical protein XBJ2_730003 [Xenorhabdus bovienii str. Jollieti]|uniref:AAA+ ATPase domain-containing protein n=1 Tax=Xenorhabdus bovienii (strain SS-2004) TaxID=406818 RepID=D3V060_XENBS|nr:AAA domain-containing protein [Xenorhabdus bovienii]CBJ80612.1 hypothetical protein XBJ1_1483 [Xenorhabdus bovienii SS-2004]CDH30321.1 hypothetical protein XBJ2_730003 [Xenorhabdus bovienii str. Jollieti]
MNINDFPMMSEDILVLSTDESTDGFEAEQAIFIRPDEQKWLAVQGNKYISITCGPADHELFSRLVLCDQVRWRLTLLQQKGKLWVQYCTPVEVSAMQLELGVDEFIADDLYGKQEIADKRIDLACEWFAENFVVSGLKEGDWLTIARFSNNSIAGSFQIIGKGWRADVERKSDGGLLIKRVTRHLRSDSAFSLLVGQFSFCDTSVAVVLKKSASQQALLDAALRDNTSYLELWNLYNEKEWQNELRRAESLRSLRFIDCVGVDEGQDNAWRLTPKSLDDYREFQKRLRELELPADTQYDLGTVAPDWAEELSMDESRAAANIPRGMLRFEADYVFFKPASNRRDIRPKQPDGWLYLSLAGYRTAGKRRLAAKQKIDSGKRMPQLKWLLEGIPVPAARYRTIPGLTPYAKEIFKGGKPTEMQEQALDAALNTPDLAIIIGPPGTGKTQVIAALQRRLAEEAQNQNIAGQVLISSFQHDAVDNALERSDVFGLPGARVGGKHRADDDESLIDSWLEQQTMHLHGKVRDEHARYPELEFFNRLSIKLAFARLAGGPNSRRAEEFSAILQDLEELEKIGSIPLSMLKSQLEDYIEQLRKQASDTTDSAIDNQLIQRIRALRVDAVSFNDDGSDRAWDLLRWIQRYDLDCAPERVSLLQAAADNLSLSTSDFHELSMWREHLLEQFLPDYRPVALKNQADPAGLALLDDIERHLDGKLRQRKQGVAWVLEQLADSLTVDRRAAQNVVNEYSMVVGATCQQAAGQQMANLKSVAGLDSSGIEFETVVVDEAARANPLDLFVPMSMARRRIVLVGDDKQLPHMLEPDIEGQLQEEHQLTEVQRAAFHSSLFERMRLKLLELEKRDQWPRVVMLDTQFRMHPVLGNFISKQFYESAGMREVKSGRDVADFAFDEKMLNALGELEPYFRDRVCQWIDLPRSEGKDRTHGSSRVREIEATRIAQEVERLVRAGGESFSIGVITFYAAQRDLIMEKLAQVRIDGVPLMEPRDGSFEPHEDFRLARKVRGDGSISYEERLRVGSVDAFQGKEFDVVLLSCVRTFDPSKPALGAQDDAAAREAQLNRRFGFLRLPNRMNVAMSRQRQMLICVGDAVLVTNPDAKEAVPALAALYQLCGGVYGSVR